MEMQEHFTAQDVAGALGMNVEGAEALLNGLVNESSTDVSFKADKVKKYTKAKK